jgi:hypothetical protein
VNRSAAVGVGGRGVLERIARVGSDPDVWSDDLRLERALDGDGRLERSPRSGEGGEEAVSGLLDDLAAALGDLLLEQSVVALEQLPPFLVAQRLEQPSRADNVREQERAASLLPAEELGSPLGIRLRADALESGMRRLELGRRSMLFTPPPERDAEKKARLRALERRSDLPPLVSRLTEPTDGLVRVVFGERDPAGSDMNAGARRVSILYESTRCSSSAAAARAVFRSRAATEIST